MTTKPKARKFRIRRSGSIGAEAASSAAGRTDAQPSRVQRPQPSSAQASATPANTAAHPTGPTLGNVDSPATVASETDIDAIRQEGLTGRQLRMARRVAQKHGLAVTSDFDAVRQLRQRGIDPFQRANVLELVAPSTEETDKAAQQMQQGGGQQNQQQGRVQLPQTVVRKQQLPSTEVGSPDNPAERRASEIRKIQQDIARRRRRNIVSLFTRLAMFVMLPTLMVGWYFYVIATPMYGTKSEFVIQQSESSGAAGLGGLFSGTGLATQTDSTTVQSFLLSRDAMLRLDEDHDFKAHFQNPEIDAIQRLDSGASNEEAYAMYQDMVLVGYDPTEGILKMEVIAADPVASQTFSEALISYAEERVDHLTQRMRQDQMADAIESYDRAELDRQEARAALTQAQVDATVLDPAGAVGALQQRISALELEMDQKRIDLAALESASRPNRARVDAIKGEIARIEDQIALLRSQVSTGIGDNASQAETVAKLREAEENYAFAVERVAAAQAAMDSARIEANRQVRFLSVSVAPIAPDEATYPRAFENTLLAFLTFAGIYLMLSLTASILREQVSS